MQVHSLVMEARAGKGPGDWVDDEGPANNEQGWPQTLHARLAPQSIS